MAVNVDNFVKRETYALVAGTAEVASQGPNWRISLYGTWAIGDTVDLSLIYNEVPYQVCGRDLRGTAPLYVMSYKDQVFLCVSNRLYTSGIQEPTGFENRYAGYGYIRVSGQKGESLQATAAAVYAGKVAVFSRNVIQLWNTSGDPAAWTLVQTLINTGTCSPKSVVSYGELDVFYLSDAGLRSIRAREFTDLVNVKDVGTPIDDELKTLLLGMSEVDKGLTFGIYSIKDGRYWLCFPSGVIYAFSYFPGSKVSAWTKYNLAYEGATRLAEGAVSVSGDLKMFWVYPAYRILASFPGTHYYDTATIVIPFFDAKTPGTRKQFRAIDIAGQGTWALSVGDDVANVATLVSIGNVTLSTFKYQRIPIGVIGTHMTLKLVHATDTAAVISSIIVHWDPYDSR